VIDADGCELLTQLGGDSPPVYDDTREPVITPRLRSRLTPVERAWWSGHPLLRYLTHRAYWLTDGSEIDGWDPADFASSALEKATRYGTENKSAIGTWIQQEVSDRRKRANLLQFEALYQEDEDGNEYLAYDVEQADFVPIVLPDTLDAWVKVHTSPRVYRALTLVAVEGYTQAEAARVAGITKQTLSGALKGLRYLMEEE